MPPSASGSRSSARRRTGTGEYSTAAVELSLSLLQLRCFEFCLFEEKTSAGLLVLLQPGPEIRVILSGPRRDEVLGRATAME